MIENQIPQSSKAYEGKKFSYASPDDSWFKRRVISTVEKLTGRNYLQKIYDTLHSMNPNPFDVWGDALDMLDIKIDFDPEKLFNIPKKGPIIFVANHPFGVVDGVIFLHLVTRIRRDYFILINEVLTHEPFLKDHLLPVDFRGDKNAIRTNLETKARTTERLNNGEALVIFPSGAVATALKFKGKVEELPWRRFITSRIHETKCTVVPLFFHGENSRLFQFVSKLSMNLRLGLLLHEIMNKRGKTIRVEIGDPIGYDQMESIKDRQKLIEFLRAKTMILGGKEGQ